jgi:hypothetical protein
MKEERRPLRGVRVAMVPRDHASVVGRTWIWTGSQPPEGLSVATGDATPRSPASVHPRRAPAAARNHEVDGLGVCCLLDDGGDRVWFRH